MVSNWLWYFPSQEKDANNRPRKRGMASGRSNCCNAPLKPSGGGIVVDICTKCGKGNPPDVLIGT